MKITLNENTPSVRHIMECDKRMAKVIGMVGEIIYEPHDNTYPFLVHEIIEQMLSIKAGAAIYCRLEELCGGDVCFESIDRLSDAEIKGIGTSNSKVRSIRELTDAMSSGRIDYENFGVMPDDEIIRQLTSVHGIGLWTAKMCLIFCQDRQDILPFEDVAFLQSYSWLYKTDDRSRESVEKKCRKWKPYRSIGARYLYRALDMGFTKEPFHLFK